MDNDIDIDKYYDELIEIALGDGLVSVAEFIAERYDVCTDPEGYLKYHSNKNNTEMVEFMFNNFDFEQKWIDNLFINSQKYCIDVVQIIIDNGANLEKYGKQLRDKAKENENYHLANYLKEIIKKKYY